MSNPDALLKRASALLKKTDHLQVQQKPDLLHIFVLFTRQERQAYRTLLLQIRLLIEPGPLPYKAVSDHQLEQLEYWARLQQALGDCDNAAAEECRQWLASEAA
jgi:hypothetical protein